MAFDHRPFAIQAHRLAVGHAYAAYFEPGGFAQKLPQGFASLFDGHAVQVKAAFKADLPQFELAHLAFLHAIARPAQLIFGSHINHKLV